MSLDADAKTNAQEVISLRDEPSGLRGFLVIHDTTRGPATGGIRLMRYRDEGEALADGYRLARAMTMKAAVSELPVGGGKIVLMEHDGFRREEALRAVGRAIESLGGRFLAGRDVGVGLADGALIRSETRYMVDESPQGVGDLNRATALGVVSGARAALSFRTGSASWEGVRVAIQGAGGVGSWLARLLSAEGAHVLVADVRASAVTGLRSEIELDVVEPHEILTVPCDVVAPCAVGGVLDVAHAEALRAAVVAGSANNILETPEAGTVLHTRGITYAPDFLINAGALIEGVRYLTMAERSTDEVLEAIGTRTLAVLERAKALGLPPEQILQQVVDRELGRKL